nr:integrase, catalytic region, zinc finger, CCHC-type, peptidase aspartic, catalytic [Tanacetum cinerariifolium]
TSSTEQPPLKDKSMWSDQEKRIQKMDRLIRSFMIQGLSNDIYSLIDSNKTAKDLCYALARHMLGSEYVNMIEKLQFCMKWKQYATMMRHNKNSMDINIDALYNILKQNQRDVNDAMGLKKKTVVVTSDPLSLIAEKIKKDVEKKRDMSRVKCYNYKKEGHFAKDFKKAKKYKDEQVLLAEDQAWMESSSDSDQEINANMVFMAQIKKVLSDSEASSSSTDEKISERYSRKNLMACNNSDTCSASDCNNTRNALCNARMNASVDVNDLFVFDDVSIRKSHVSKMPFRKKPHDYLNVRSKSNSGCSKHMTGNRALLTHFVEKFLGTVHFGNNDFAVITGYGDVVIGSMTIKKVYYVEGL